MIIGYGVCGKEADRYLEATLKEFARLCDDTIILLNNATDKEKELITKYGFKTIEDNREWGMWQHRIKEDLMQEVKKLNPTHCVCLDMDEVFDQELTKDKLVKLFDTGHALYFYMVNLWEEGWNRKQSFWNIRAWTWSEDLKFENKPLHCGLAPAWCYRFGSYAPYFVKHYGLMKKEDRQKKIARYEKYDPEAKFKAKQYYDALHNDGYDILDENFIRNAIANEVGIQKKRENTEVKKVFYYVESPAGKVIDVPEKNLKETLSRGFKLICKVGE